MAAMGAEDVVLGRQRKRHADCGGFLANGQMRRTQMVVAHALEDAFQLDLIQREFKLANDAHIAVDIEKLVPRVNGGLLLECLAVGIQIDVPELNPGAGKYLLRLDRD